MYSLATHSYSSSEIWLFAATKRKHVKLAIASYVCTIMSKFVMSNGYTLKMNFIRTVIILSQQ